MNRRQAVVSAIVGAFGITLFKPDTLVCLPRLQLSPQRQGTGYIQEFNQRVAFETTVGDWRLWFTGYKAAWDTSMLGAQALAYPELSRWPAGVPHRFYYAAIPGGEDAFKPGDTFSFGGTEGLYAEEACLSFHPKGLEKALRLRDDAFARLLKVMREHGEQV